MKTLYLIDGHALAYRAYFALTAAGTDTSRWVTRAGEPTAGTYGFTAILFRIIEQDQPDYLAVSFDVGATFRDTLYPDYKGTRAKMPDDLRTQIDRMREVVAAFNIPILEAEGYEADDVLGTIAKQAAAQGVQVIIATGDRDLLQLADKRVRISLAGQKLSEAVVYGPDEVKEKYGVTPKQYIDYKALVGDTSDNIPGVAGVGEKTATSLLQEYGSLDAIYKHLDKIPARFKSKLETGKENAYLSQKLATIVTDVALTFNLEACESPHLKPPLNFDRQRVLDLFRVLEFRSLLAKLPETEALPADKDSARASREAANSQMGLFGEPALAVSGGLPVPPRPPISTVTRPILISDLQSLNDLAAQLAKAPIIAVDTETTGVDANAATLVGISLCIKEGEGYYIPVGHQLPNPNSQNPNSPREASNLQLQTVIEALTPSLTNPRIPKIGHNIGYDYTILKRHGLTVSPISFDTMLAEWVCDPGSRNLGLKNLAFIRLGVEMTEIKELIGTGKKQITFDQVPLDAAAPYAVADVDMTLRLMPILKKELEEKGQLKLLEEIELPCITVLAEMEMAGIMIDADFLGGMSKELEKKLATLEKKIYKAVGYEFNINSTQQLAKALFEDLKLEPPDKSRKTSSGKYSTAADVLEEMRGQNPVLDQILEHREIAKLKGTYVDALPLTINPETGRIHTSFNQAGSVTGRLASSNPNLQNIPIRTELGREVRKAFIAPRGRRLVAADYSQVELRIAAHFAKEKFWIDAFKRGDDIHAATASAVFGVPLNKVSKEERRNAKAINFGLLYGMGAFTLARNTGLTLGEAEEFMQKYFAELPGVKRYIEETKRKAATEGYVETLLGRRRYFPILTRPGTTREDHVFRARAEREAVNSPVQGTASDIIKIAMLRLAKELPKKIPSARMLLQVHDELVFECDTDEVEQVAALARKIMEGAFKLDAPLAVDVRAGKNWEEMKAVS
ncbi:MAG: DNA polymerase I [Chloroflexi bacterium]|nr:DNA polymerase I [Chloroflexota bacterium]